MKYQETLIQDPGIGPAVHVRVFRANDLYDPDVTVTGHQPRGFDEIMPLYDHFCVVGSKISVNFQPASATALPWICGIALLDNTTLLTTPTSYMESRNVVWKTMNSVSNGVTVSKTFSAKKFFTKPHPLSVDSLRGNNSSSPTEGAYYHVFVAGIGVGSDAGITQNSAMLNYSAIFSEPKNPGIS